MGSNKVMGRHQHCLAMRMDAFGDRYIGFLISNRFHDNLRRLQADNKVQLDVLDRFLCADNMDTNAG